MYSLPTARNLKDQLVNTARHCLVDCPGPFVHLMKSGIPQAHIDLLWSALAMPTTESMYEQQLPSGDKLLAVRTPDDDNQGYLANIKTTLYTMIKFVSLIKATMFRQQL